MTQPFKPRQIVAAPTRTLLPFGLLTSLSDVIRNPTDQHWQGGVTWESHCSTSLIGLTYDECLVVSGIGGEVSGPPVKDATAMMEDRGALPFTVYALMECSVNDFYGRSTSEIRMSLTQFEQRAVESALWTGRAGINNETVFPHLAADTEVVEAKTAYNRSITLQTKAEIVTGAGLGSLVEVVGALEQELAECYSGVGVLHVQRKLAPLFARDHLLIQDGNRYRTPNGNIVVFGEGYVGTGPDGTGTNWIYATGMPFIYRGDMTVFERTSFVNRKTNTVMALAERTYLIGWDCCHLAGRVTEEIV